MNIVIMITGSIVGGTYNELFIAWYSGVEYEQYAFLNRANSLLVGVFNDDVL
jgi:molybdopterin-containing oxidoreductase family membrane subunit